MDNTHDASEPPSLKRIKLEEDSTFAPVSSNFQSLSSAATTTSAGSANGRGRKSKKTLEEKAKDLLKDSRIGAVEPQQVLCRMCGRWIRLFRHTDFAKANWIAHADRCAMKTQWVQRVKREPEDAFSLPVNFATETTPVVDVPAQPSTSTLQQQRRTATPPESISTRAPGRSVSERAAVLANDPRVAGYDAHSVQCRLCGERIQLHAVREFDLLGWNRHIEGCEKRGRGEGGEGGGGSLGTAAGPVSAPPTDELHTPPRLKKPAKTHLTHPVLPLMPLGNPKPPTPPVLDLTPASISAPVKSEPKLDMESIYSYTPALKKKKGRSVLERMEGLQQDPRCGEVQPHQVFCLMCNRWIKLYREVEYIDSNWLRHAERCSNRMTEAKSGNGAVGESSGGASKSSVKRLKEAPKAKIKDVTRPKDVSKTAETALPQKSVQQREALLRMDPLVEEVESKRVRCKLCQKWVDLNKELDFDPGNWQLHLSTCPCVSQPSISQARPRHALKEEPNGKHTANEVSTTSKVRDPRSTEERRQELLNDGRCEKIEEHRVFCTLCQSYVGLHSKKDYSTSNWYKHVKCCESKSVKRKREDPIDSTECTSMTGNKPTLSSMKTRSLQLSPKSPLPSGSGSGQTQIPPTSSTSAPNFSQQPLLVPGFPMLSNPLVSLTTSTSAVELSHPLKDVSMPTLSALTSRLSPQGLSSQQPSGEAQSDIVELTKDPVQMAISQAVASIAASNSAFQAADLRQATEERKQRLLKDERVAEVEPHRVRCKMCMNWYKLSNEVEYATFNWSRHVKRCTGKPDETPESQPAQETVRLEHRQTPPAPEVVVPTPLTPSPTPAAVKEESLPDLFTREPLLGRRTTAAERLARLQKDTRLKTLEAHRAECGLCGKWIKLQNKTEYDPHNWNMHILKCALRSNNAPAESANDISAESFPIASETVYQGKQEARIAEFMEDPRCAVAEPNRALCNLCKQWIKLRDDQQYSLTNWHKHIQRCEKHLNFPGGSNPTKEILDRIQRPEPHLNSHTQTQTQTRGQGQGHTFSNVKHEPTELRMPVPITSTGKQRRTEAEREAELRSDPRLDAVEPGRVFCKQCQSWIKLNAATGYLPSNWYRHAERCGRKRGRVGELSTVANNSVKKPSPPIPPTEEPKQTSTLTSSIPLQSASEVIDLVEDDDGVFGSIELGHLVDAFEPAVSSTEFVVPDVSAPRQGGTAVGASLPSIQLSSRMSQLKPRLSTDIGRGGGKRGHRSSDLRKAELEADPRTRTVEAGRILCGMCDKWIQTRQDVAYSGQNWLKHAGICERRSGWLQREGKQASPNANANATVEPQPQPLPEYTQPDVEMRDEVHEPDLPYSARQMAIYEKSLAAFGGEGAAPPVFKPVDWSQQVTYDDEDEDDDEDDDMDYIDYDEHDSMTVTSTIAEVDDPRTVTVMDVDVNAHVPPPSPTAVSSAGTDLHMNDLESRSRTFLVSKKQTIAPPLSPTLSKAKTSLVESSSPAQLRASLSPVNAFTILSHPSSHTHKTPYSPGPGMALEGLITPITI